MIHIQSKSIYKFNVNFRVKNLVYIILADFRQNNLHFFTKHFSNKLNKMRKALSKSIQNAVNGRDIFNNVGF